jgi:hypothetical protein
MPVAEVGRRCREMRVGKAPVPGRHRHAPIRRIAESDGRRRQAWGGRGIQIGAIGRTRGLRTYQLPRNLPPVDGGKPAFASVDPDEEPVMRGECPDIEIAVVIEVDGDDRDHRIAERQHGRRRARELDDDGTVSMMGKVDPIGDAVAVEVGSNCGKGWGCAQAQNCDDARQGQIESATTERRSHQA